MPPTPMTLNDREGNLSCF